MQPKPPTRKALLAALEEIAGTIIPSRPVAGLGSMVEESVVIHLVDLAREALGLPKTEED